MQRYQNASEFLKYIIRKLFDFGWEKHILKPSFYTVIKYFGMVVWDGVYV